jgi:predicted ribosomally synthesized peptide with SipW-like signal peptide
MDKTNQPERDFRSRRTKALVAAAIGLALLVGGGSTFAYWSDSSIAEVGEVNTGVLDLTEETDLLAYDISGDAAGRNQTTKVGYWGKPIDLADFKTVPEDSIEMDWTNTITLVGTNMKSATLTVTSDKAPGPLPTDWSIDYWIIEGGAFVVGKYQGAGDNGNALLTGSGLLYNIDATKFNTDVEYTVVIRAQYKGSSTSGHPTDTYVPFDLGKLTITLTQGDRPNADPTTPPLPTPPDPVTPPDQGGSNEMTAQ